MSRTIARNSDGTLRAVAGVLLSLVIFVSPAYAFDDTASLELSGTIAGERFGDAVACHLGQAVIGAPGGGLSGAGAVTFFDPVAGAAIQTVTSPDTDGDSAFGSVLAPLEDVSGDAIEDIAVSAPGSQGTGAVFIYAGTLPGGVGTAGPIASFDGAGTSGSFGRTIVSLGDTNGDGLAEIAVSSAGIGSSNDGAVHVLDVAAQTSLYVISGVTGDDLGESLASMGDIDGDGVRELVAGAPGANSGRGSVRIYSGASGAILSTVNGNTEGQVFGQALANVGDVDADGFDDLLIGSPSTGGSSGAGVGRARLISGGSILSFPIRSLCDIRGTGFGDRFGATLTAISDVSGDSIGDFAIGAPNTPLIVDDGGDEVTTENLGTVHVYRFSSDGCRAFDVLNGPTPRENKQLGVSLASCVFGDDAFPDLIAGSRADQNGNNSGSAVIFSGEPPPAPPSVASFRFKISRDGDFTARIEYDTDPFGNCDLEVFGRSEQLGVVNDVFLLGEGTPQGKVNVLTVEGFPRAKKIGMDKPILHAIVRTTCGSTVIDSNIFARFLNCGALPALQLEDWEASVEGILDGEAGASLTVKERRPKTKKERMKERRKRKAKNERMARMRRR